ncbi:MAG: hypothetical protein LBQ73_09155 [Tannerellaceae bacterium]|jgi:hypothetical protein|nr:hypothetical protein [Tannerellaceae bacterium]
MAGVKGRSGLPKGRTNNPKGKPIGAVNKVSVSVKSRIAKYVEDDFDSFIKVMEGLEGKDRVKAEIELIKLVVPRPVNQEELDAIAQSQSPLIAKLFMNRAKEKE